MIADVIYDWKTILFIVGVYQFYRLRLYYLILLAIPFFMPGVETITSGYSSWTFPLSSATSSAEVMTLVNTGINSLPPEIRYTFIDFDEARQNWNHLNGVLGTIDP